MPGDLWSDLEANEARIAASIGTHCYGEVAARLGRTPSTVKGIASGRSWRDAKPIFLQYAG